MVDINIKLEIPGSEQLLKMLASGIGAVGGPMLARVTARAEADALRIKAQGEADALRIEAHGKGDALRLIVAAQAEAQQSFSRPPSSIHGEIEVRGEIEARLSFQEEKRQANIESVVRGAAAELGEKQVQAHDVDHDWTARFFTEVQDVSSEKLQQIWAKILAGEVETPGKTSMQTLSILKNMSQRDAELFQRVAPFIIKDFVLKDASTGKISGFPSYLDFLKLSYHNLVHVGSGLHKTFEEQSDHHFQDHDIVYQITKSDPGTFSIAIPCHALTPSGQELYAFIQCSKNEDYLGVLAAFLKKNDDGKLASARILARIGSNLRTEPWRDIEPRIP